MRSHIYGISAAAAMLAASGPAQATHSNQIGSGRRRIEPGTRVLANLSVFHPDYGMTPAEHEAAKAERKAGKRKFVDKAELSKRRGGLIGRIGR